MIGVDFSNPRLDIVDVAYAALAAEDHDQIAFLAAGAATVPLSLKVPGCLRVRPSAPAKAIATAERLLGEQLPAACVARLALENASSIMAALARVLHSERPFAEVMAEIDAWDALCASQQIRVRRTADGWHRIECPDEIAHEQEFADVLRWLRWRVN